MLPCGVVLSEFPSWRRMPHRDTHVTVYLEVVDGVLRVKVGAWDKPANLHDATRTVLPRVHAAFEAKGFHVEAAPRAPGTSVTLLVVRPKEPGASHEVRVEYQHHAYEAWRAGLG